MRQMLGSLSKSRNSLKITQEGLEHANNLGVPIQISGADTIKINEIIYESTPEIYKALTYSTYTGNTMKNGKDILMMYNVLRSRIHWHRGQRFKKKNNSHTKTSRTS